MKISTKTPTFLILQEEWARVSRSGEVLEAIRSWTQGHPLLAGTSPEEIVLLFEKQSWSRLRERDEALKCALEHSTEPLCQLMVLRSLLPQMKHMVDKTMTDDADEYAALVVSAAVEQIAKWNQRDIVCVHWWLYRNIHAKALQNLRHLNERKAREAEALSPDPELLPASAIAAANTEEMCTRDLVSLVMQKGDLDRLSAEIVVLTRTGCYSVEAIARSVGTTPQNLRQKRRRAEIRLRNNLKAEDFA